MAAHFFGAHQFVVALASHTTSQIQGHAIRAQAVQHTCHIHAATAWVLERGAATHLVRVAHLIDGGEHIQRGVEGDGEDIGHMCASC